VLQAKGIVLRPTTPDDNLNRNEATSSQTSVNAEVNTTSSGSTCEIKQEGIPPESERDEDENDEILIKERELMVSVYIS
jgi:hypothetical protein